MAGGFRALHLLRKVREDQTLTNTDVDDGIPGLHREIGNITYRIVLRRDKYRPIRFHLKNEVAAAPAVAKKLAELGPVNTFFTFEVYENALTIPSFADAASLEEILEARAHWPFHPEHSRALAADILAGISSLRSVGLQRNAFDVRDVLLVGRDNMYFFQIAGIENCTCISDDEPTTSGDLSSLVHILKYVIDRLEPHSFTWIYGFLKDLERRKTLDDAFLKEATQSLPSSADRLHRELEIYLHAVRILGTTMGGSSIGDAR
ncbi:hypothetical protein PMIN04_007921 [Paraphaeosphaeria minitans]|uniref:Protein kinase domain-containing protein n=1 Tax=Paraphaeosphaeria minitans TaxID=565426 RepID=A0A9P6G9H6_9PLEO|nr:hypothetical protein PMIN01_12077 [Paraphaeosphaeria minitans]